MIHHPLIADLVVERLDNGPLEGCLEELAESTRKLDDEGFWWRPRWTQLRAGGWPPQVDVGGEPGEWQHGWQYWTRTRTLLLNRTAARRAHLRGGIGTCSHAPEYTIPPHLFRTLILQRLQLPLRITESLCEGCHAPSDPLGRHRASCTRSGRIKKRATPTERTVARIFREAGGCVRQNVFLRDTNINVAAQDSRRIEVPKICLASVEHSWRWTSLYATHLTSNGEAHPQAADVDGSSLDPGKTRQGNVPIATSGRCKLVVLAIETGGKWSEEAVQIVRMLAFAKAREVPSNMQFLVALMWECRWTRMLATHEMLFQDFAS